VSRERDHCPIGFNAGCSVEFSVRPTTPPPLLLFECVRQVSGARFSAWDTKTLKRSAPDNNQDQSTAVTQPITLLLLPGTSEQFACATDRRATSFTAIRRHNWATRRDFPGSESWVSKLTPTEDCYTTRSMYSSIPYSQFLPISATSAQYHRPFSQRTSLPKEPGSHPILSPKTALSVETKLDQRGIRSEVASAKGRILTFPGSWDPRSKLFFFHLTPTNIHFFLQPRSSHPQPFFFSTAQIAAEQRINQHGCFPITTPI